MFDCTLSCPLELFRPSPSQSVLSPAVLLFLSVTLVTLHLLTPCRSLFWPPPEKWEKLSCLSAAVFFPIHLNSLHLPPPVSHGVCFHLSVFLSLTPLVFLSLRLTFGLYMPHLTLWSYSTQKLCLHLCVFEIRTEREYSGDSVGQHYSFYPANLCSASITVTHLLLLSLSLIFWWRQAAGFWPKVVMATNDWRQTCLCCLYLLSVCICMLCTQKCKQPDVKIKIM